MFQLKLKLVSESISSSITKRTVSPTSKELKSCITLLLLELIIEEVFIPPKKSGLTLVVIIPAYVKSSSLPVLRFKVKGCLGAFLITVILLHYLKLLLLLVHL